MCASQKKPLNFLRRHSNNVVTVQAIVYKQVILWGNSITIVRQYHETTPSFRFQHYPPTTGYIYIEKHFHQKNTIQFDSMVVGCGYNRKFQWDIT